MTAAKEKVNEKEKRKPTRITTNGSLLTIIDCEDIKDYPEKDTSPAYRSKLANHLHEFADNLDQEIQYLLSL